ncbi:hypothetical protein QE443_000366 [Pantoea ananatis]|nr:hypothetical protein [Pantoea ananatis]MDR6090059.1 hypothetical protein [Pantoea ananatis]
MKFGGNGSQIGWWQCKQKELERAGKAKPRQISIHSNRDLLRLTYG